MFRTSLDYTKATSVFLILLFLREPRTAGPSPGDADDPALPMYSVVAPAFMSDNGLVSAT
jgi:hypothetical protein